MDKFQVFYLSEKNLDLRRREKEGAVPKDWVRTSEGQALFKDAGKRPYNPEIRNDWPEKIVSELATRLNLPAARYELAQLETPTEIQEGSISFEIYDYGGKRTALESSCEKLFPRYNYGSDYNVSNVIFILEQQNVQLPPGYSLPEGINDGVDLFVGALMLDAYTVNIDRHCRNFDLIELKDEGIIYLSPIFDNGRSLGSCLQDEAKVDRSISDYAISAKSSITIDGYNKSGLEVFQEAAKFRPQAAAIWQNQLSQISQQEIQDLFSRIPDGIISSVSREFATELLSYNQSQILNLDLNYQQEANSPTKKNYSQTFVIDTTKQIETVHFELSSNAKYIFFYNGEKTFISSDGVTIEKTDNLTIRFEEKLIEFNQTFEVVKNDFTNLELRQLNHLVEANKQQIQEQTQKRRDSPDHDQGYSL